MTSFVENAVEVIKKKSKGKGCALRLAICDCSFLVTAYGCAQWDNNKWMAVALDCGLQRKGGLRVTYQIILIFQKNVEFYN